MNAGRTLHWDQSATARPKSLEAAEDFRAYMESYTATPRRGSYKAARTVAQTVEHARDTVAQFVELPAGGHVVFTSGTTEALNLAILGCLSPGDHVIASAFEHNSVLRPLRLLEERGEIRIDYVEPNDYGAILVPRILNRLRDSTRLVCMTHVSNVVGNLQDVGALGHALRGTQARLLVDAAQTAGLVPIDMDTWGAHLVAFSGHKALQSVPGIGCLAVAPNIELRPLRVGGTGGTDAFELFPLAMPIRLEAGTPNTVGIYILSRAIERLDRAEILKRGLAGRELRSRLLRDIAGVRGVRLTAPHGESPAPVLSIELPGLPAAVVATALDEEFDVEVRSGFHCAPMVHRWMGTLDHGTIRLSPPVSASQDEVVYVLTAIERIAAQGRRTA